MEKTPVFILAGGLGTRLSEETVARPKPMVEVGDLPILLHIMKTYYQQGFNDFVICAGYKSWEIKQYFLNYEFRTQSMVVDHRQNIGAPPQSMGTKSSERWRVRIIDTGLETMTGARVAKAFDEVTQNGAAPADSFENFALTYGDGLSDVDLKKEFAFHSAHQKIGTVLGVSPLARFGDLSIQDGFVKEFREKPASGQGTISGGFFFFKKEFRKYLSTDEDCFLEREPLAKLAKDLQLKVFEHSGFWHPMDTLRDKNYLQGLYEGQKAPWIQKGNLK